MTAPWAAAKLAQGFAPRHYRDQWEAFEETAISRLYGGIHFRSDIEAGRSTDTACQWSGSSGMVP